MRQLSTLLCIALFFWGCPAANNPPIADAGSPQTVDLGVTVTLDATASVDPDGDTLHFQWQVTTRPLDSVISLQAAGTAHPSFTPDRPGAYIFQLTVFDAATSSAPDQVAITVNGTLTIVPNLVGLTEGAAESALSGVGLILGEVTRQSSPTIESGLVLSHSPTADAEVTLGSAVAIVLSSGPGDVTMPDLRGLSRSEAEAQLLAAGLFIGTISQADDDEAVAGTVLSQSIEAGTVIVQGSIVDLVVAAGPPIAIEKRHAINLREILQDPGDQNLSRPNAVAVDPTSSRAYITALLTPHVAMLDTDTGTITGTLDTGFLLPGNKIPCVSPDGSALLVVDETTNTLARIDIATNAVTATAPVGAGVLDLVIAGPVNTVYIARTTAPNLLLLNSVSLAEIGTSNVLDGVRPRLTVDQSTGNLHILATATEGENGRLYVFDTANNTLAKTLDFDMPGTGPSTAIKLDFDAVNQRYFILGTRGLDIYGTDGARIRVLVPHTDIAFTDMQYFATATPANDRILALGLSKPSDGTVSARGAQLAAFNPNPGQATSAIDTVNLGERNTAFAVHPLSQKLITPDSTTGTLWSLKAAPFPIQPAPIHLGMNIDQIAVINGALFGTSRFGGNLLFRLTPGENAVTTFEAGLWPAPFRPRKRDIAVPTLVILNAWDSTVQEFSADTSPMSKATRPTGFPVGTTERLPDLAIHPNGAVAAVAYPEFGQVQLRSLVSGTEIAILDIPDAITGDAPSGKGQVQLLFSQGGENLLYVFDRDQRRLHRFDTANSYALVGSTDLSNGLGAMESAPPAEWLVQDSGLNRLYLGPLQLDPVTGLAAGPALPAGQLIRGIDPDRDLYWTVGQTESASGYSVVVRALARTENTVADTFLNIEGTHAVAPEFAFDTENRRFFVAYPDTTSIEEYGY